ncbi:hypothetical protein EJD97_015027 [Solanum chilense]|uniref:Uncharacterized protein n=1 Tax=Solanum chilense TaxID=4083 RepID=A0A6N2C8Y9_SOLCI|nr:hypothetical protein EJD97_015027 [Solanum chilense]
MFGELPRVVTKEVKEYKKLKIYKRATVAERIKVLIVMSAKDVRIQYNMHTFTGQDFMNMTSMKVWWENRLVDEFEWDEDMIDYVRSIRPYPGGMDKIGAKRILTVMNMNNTHFVTLEIFLHEDRMNVYECQLMGMEHAKFLTYIQPFFELLPKLLKQSGIMKHFLEKFLDDP